MDTNEERLFNSTRNRAEGEIEEAWNELVENTVNRDYRITDYNPSEGFPADGEIIEGIQSGVGETEIEKRFSDFADSLWQLYERIGEFSIESSEAQAFAVYSTTMMVFGDWQEIRRRLATDDVIRSSHKVTNFVNKITNILGNLSNKILNLLSNVTSLDGWELSGDLSGNVPGFAKGGVSLTLKFS